VTVSPDGTQTQVELARVRVPNFAHRGTLVVIHPTSDGAIVTVEGIGSSGSLLACPTDGYPGTPPRTGEPCQRVPTGHRVVLKLRQATGSAHVGIEFVGTWPRTATIRRVVVEYTQVDRFVWVGAAR